MDSVSVNFTKKKERIMSITRLAMNGQQPFNSQGSFTNQLLGQPTSHFRPDDDRYSLIDYSVAGNRLYQRLDGSVGIAEKNLGYVIGEQVVRPLIDAVYYLGVNVIHSTPTQMVVNGTGRCVSGTLSYIQYFAKRVDGMLSFPVAEAAPLPSTKHDYVKEVKCHIKEAYQQYSEVTDTIDRVTNGEAEEEVEPSKLEKVGKFFEKLKAIWNVITGPADWYEELVQGELEESAVKQLKKLEKVYKKIDPLEHHFELQRQKNQCQGQFGSTAQRMNELMDKETNIRAQAQKEIESFDTSQRYYAEVLQRMSARTKREGEITPIYEQKKALAQNLLMGGSWIVPAALSDEIHIYENELDQLYEAQRKDKINGDIHYNNMEKAKLNIDIFNKQIDLLNDEYGKLKEKLDRLREEWVQIHSKIDENKDEL